MRGEDIQQHQLFSYGSLEERVPADDPLRPIRGMVDEALKALDGRFEEIYGEDGRKIDSSGTAAAGVVASDAVLGAEREDADGTAPVQLALPLACRWMSRCGIRRCSPRIATGCWKGQ